MFDRNFRALTHPYVLSKYEKRVPRQKIKENRSLNRFSTMLRSSFRCLNVSHVYQAVSYVVFNFCVYHPPSPRAWGKGLHCEMPGGMVETNVEDHITVLFRYDRNVLLCIREKRVLELPNS